MSRRVRTRAPFHPTIEMLETRCVPTLFPAVVPLSALNGGNGFTLNGVTDDYAGRAVAMAGDVNGDEFDDLIIGARDANGDNGRAYVVFGSSAGFPKDFALSSLNGSNGFTLNSTAAGAEAGFAVAGAGDVNGDGFDDLLIGSQITSGPGQAYVVFGQSTFGQSFALSELDGSNGFILNGASSGDYAGFAVAGAGDVNGDNFADLIIGAPRTGSSAGAAYVVFGHSGSFTNPLSLSSLAASAGFTLNGITGNDQAGYAVAGAGDVNGDGLDDVFIGAPFADSSAGQGYVVFGQTAGFASLNLSALNGSNGFALDGIAANDNAAIAVAGGGDFDGDGVDDLLLGAPKAGSGQAYLVYGRLPVVVVGPDKGSAPVVQVFQASGKLLFTIAPYPLNFTGGVRVAVGNTQGSGAAEIVTVKSSGTPTLRVFSGAGTQLHQFTVTGNFVAVGNVNNTGLAEIIVGSVAGQPARVRIYNGTTGQLGTTLTPYPMSSSFTGGVRVAVVTNGSQANLLTGPGAGLAARVKIFNGVGPAVLDSFFAYDEDFTVGVFVAGG